MRKANFLNELYKEEKLKEVEPNEIIAKAYLEKSRKSISSAKALLEIGNLEDSVVLAYYGMYHSAIALLFRTGIKCENHSAAIVLLKKVFNIDNSAISKAKYERVDKQYYIDFSISRQETMDAIKSAEDFSSKLKDFIDRLSNENIAEYHKAAIKIILA